MFEKPCFLMSAQAKAKPKLNLVHTLYGIKVHTRKRSFYGRYNSLLLYLNANTQTFSSTHADINFC